MQVTWEDLIYPMYSSYPTVHKVIIHDTNTMLEGRGVSDLQKYMYRPGIIAARCFTSSSAPLMLTFFERITTESKAPSCVLAALGDPRGSVKSKLGSLPWPVYGVNGPAFYAIINDTPY